MDDKSFPMEYFTPIITINETSPAPSSPVKKIKKIKIKIEGNKDGELSGEIVKPKRGRPRKHPKVNNAEANKEKTQADATEDENDNNDDEDYVNDPSWDVTDRKKKLKKHKYDKKRKPKQSKKKKDLVEISLKQSETEESCVKQEPDDNGDISIKEEIKEEPCELPVILPLSDEEFKAMLPQVSEERNTFRCPLCSKEKLDFLERSLAELKQHYRQEHPGKRLRLSRYTSEAHPCDICGKEFKTSGAVREHIETHSNYFYCEVCNASQKKILDHIIHLRVHSELGIFQCLMCSFNSPDINIITDHVNNHEDLLKYWCQTCKKGFQILPWFQEHDNYHTGLKPFDCEFCGKCFLYSRYLHAHKINMHKDGISFPSLHECVICKKQYQHKNSLKLHMNSHTGNFSICDICGKMLSSKEKLKFHIRTHTGYKPYSCTYCEKSFTKKPILVEHIRIHTGERPYVCDYCSKAFSQRSSLVIHMRGHTGERPYVCQFCTKGFVAKAMLNIHLKTCKGVVFGHEDRSSV